MITVITESFSEGVAAENQAWEFYREKADSLIKANSSEEFYTSGDSIAPRHYKELFSLDKQIKILDVGVGVGQSSVFLASRGNNVSSLEPNELFCKNLVEISNKLKLPIRVYRGVAEDISKIDGNFDCIIFNASLHHCDEPIKALAACKTKTKAIYLVNESFLRPWKTKKWYQWMLDNKPEEIGHYGGNEHVYYNWEYIKMLKLGGYKVDLLPPNFEKPLKRLKFYVDRQLNAGVETNSLARLFIRYFYYILEDKMRKNKVIFNIMARLSVFQCHFHGIKK
jgi:SAM-dependent methyltransferase